MSGFLTTYADEDTRRKGPSQTRLGPRISLNNKSRTETRGLNPDEKSLKKLRKFLIDDGRLSRDDINNYIGTMELSEHIRFMNIPVLTQVIVFIHNIPGAYTVYYQNFEYIGEFFTSNILNPYIDRLITKHEIKGKKSQEYELNIMHLRMIATFIRYTKYILNLRSIEMENVDIPQNVISPPSPRIPLSPPQPLERTVLSPKQSFIPPQPLQRVIPPQPLQRIVPPTPKLVSPQPLQNIKPPTPFIPLQKLVPSTPRLVPLQPLQKPILSTPKLVPPQPLQKPVVSTPRLIPPQPLQRVVTTSISQGNLPVTRKLF